ncbi:MAG: hypothetical protein ACLUIQ_11235 [Dialister invisus]
MKNTKGVLEYVAETFRKGDVLSALCGSTRLTEERKSFLKSTAGLPMKNTKRRKRTWKRSALKTDISSRKNLPIKVLFRFDGTGWNAPLEAIQKIKHQ